MITKTIDVDFTVDGTLVIQPHDALTAEDAFELRRTVVHAVRRIRPLRLVLDLADLQDVDAISLGTLAAACDLGDDHQVAVFLDNSSPLLAERLAAAGVPRHRLRRVVAGRRTGPLSAE